MTIENTSYRVTYTGNGSTLAFSFPWRILASDEITVVVQSTAGVDSTKVLDSDYTVTGVGDEGGFVNFTTAPAASEIVQIFVDPDLEQLLDYVEAGGAFPAQSHEDAMDRLTNMVKRAHDYGSRALRLSEGDVPGSGQYDAGSNKIENVEDGTALQDAATLANVNAKIAAAELSVSTDVLTALGGGYTIDLYRYLIDDTGAVSRDLNERLTQTKSVKDFGAVGDDSTDDTAAFQLAVDAGGWIYIPEGTYRLDEVLVTNEVHIVCDPNAILKQRSLTASQNQAILHFSGTGANRSTVDGGQFSGNIIVLQSGFTDEVMCGIRLTGTSYVRVSNAYFYDFLHTALYHGSGSYVLYDNLWISNCGKGAIIQNANYGEFRNVVFENLSDHSEAIYQHATEIRDATGFRMSNCVVTNFRPTTASLEPSPIAFAFERMDAMSLDGLTAKGFTGSVPSTPGTGQPVGFLLDNCRNSTVRGLSVSGGYAAGMLVQSCENMAICDATIDLEYTSTGTARHGVVVRNGGLFDAVAAGATSENARANGGCFNVTFDNVNVQSAADNGFQIASGDVTFDGCSAIGCDDHGFAVVNSLANTLFQNPPSYKPQNVVFNGCRAKNNGAAGLRVTAGEHITVNGGQYSNNGQDTGAGANDRTGIRVVDGDTVQIVGVECCDTQDWATKTDGASFEPGATVSDQYTVNLIDPQHIELGQYILLNDAGGPAVDATAKVVAKDLDAITVEVTGGFTFSASGNTTALTGTFDSSTLVLTGTGSALDTEIIGRTFVTDGSVYREIIRVNSSTGGVIDAAFSPDLSTDSLSKLTIDVDAIASQRHGVYVDSTASEVFCDGISGTGNTVSLYATADPSAFLHIGPSGRDRVSVASAATTTIPYGVEYVYITGTTGITTITGGYQGQRVTLEFADSVTVTDGSGINLDGSVNFGATAGDTLSLIFNGTNWIETSRSVI